MMMKPNTVFIAVVLVAAVIGIGLLLQSSKGKSAISVNEAQNIIARDTTVLVLDVRTPEEYTGELGHIAHALLIPVQELEARVNELEPYKDKTILAVCRTGHRSGIATELLAKKGFKVMNVAGGMTKWNEEKLPVVKEKK